MTCCVLKTKQKSDCVTTEGREKAPSSPLYRVLFDVFQETIAREFHVQCFVLCAECPPIKQPLEVAADATVKIETETAAPFSLPSYASGVYTKMKLDDDENETHLIVTNDHVVRSKKKMEVIFRDTEQNRNFYANSTSAGAARRLHIRSVPLLAVGPPYSFSSAIRRL